MRPGGRLAAAIELLDLIETDCRPADMLIRDYFRQRRYAGSKDRRNITDAVYRVLRSRESIDWRLAGADLSKSNRLRLFASVEPEELKQASSDTHAPAMPDAGEADKLERARGLADDKMPTAARINLPQWLYDLLAEAMPDASEEELAASVGPRAETDIRVALRHASRNAVQAELSAEATETTPLDWVPTALRLSGPVRVEGLAAYREGRIEVQDAGSQFAALLVGAQPGERVADICAGAGGKALAIADRMTDRGQIFASDVDGRRLGRLKDRADRAGLRCVETEPVGATAAWPEGWEGSMDRVLIDAPCSGSGTWRRQPEQRFRLTPERLAELRQLQAGILDRGARLVRPGGRLVYVTCSFLRQENETTVTEFLDRNREFSLTPWAVAAREASLPLPPGEMAEQSMLRLSPYRHSVDGFFAAVLTRAIG